MSTVSPADREQQSFAETALRLGGKTEEEARRTGAVDKADEQVESLFAPQYQTVNSPIHRAVWDGKVPLELFAPPPLPASAALRSRPWKRRWTSSAAAAKPGHAARRATARSPPRRSTNWPRPATGACSSIRNTAARARRSPASRRFLTRMATLDPMIAGLASVHGCIGAVDPVRTFGNAGAESSASCRAWPAGEALSGFALTEPVRRLRPDRPAHHGRARRRRLRRQRREAVHHQRRARPHDRPGRA